MKYTINFKDLQEQFDKVNIKCVEGICVLPDNIPIIELSTLETYIDLLSDLKAKNVFYTIRYYDEDEYFIGEDNTLLEYGEKIFDLIKHKIAEYNSKIKDFNFDIPYRINFYFVKDNIAYLFTIEDEWLENEDIFSGNVELSVMMDEIQPKLEEIELKQKREKENLIEKLKAIILEDEDFKFCTNQSLRNTYAKQLMNSDNFVKYRSCFETTTGYFDQNDFRNFIELLWKKMNVKN